jgi:glycerol kinase
MPSGSSIPISLSLDLGTTLIKSALLSDSGSLGEIFSTPAPPLTGEELIRESDPVAYLDAATALLKKTAAGLPDGTPLGIATQRSSFLLWEKTSGKPLTPLISWQDRRAAGWCKAHEADEKFIRETTGLRLSPHYAGPKLASLLEDSPGLRAGMASGEILFGTLECWLVWNWTFHAVHATDLTVAARTLMADPRDGNWSEELLGKFGVPRAALPKIVPSAGRASNLDNGLTLKACLADQAAGALTAFDDAGEDLVINLGTGGFILRSTGLEFRHLSGYLGGPMFAAGAERRYALEGTINGAAGAVDPFGAGPTALENEDPSPAAFCLPDRAGIGSPHWRPDVPFSFSRAAARLPLAGQRRAALEGVVFRMREIVDDFSRARPLRKILLSGGLANDPFVPAALAACLGRSIEVMECPEATLLGAARLAAGLSPAGGVPTREVTPGNAGSYLREKYSGWREWLWELLADSA